MQKARRISLRSALVNFLALHAIGLVCLVIPDKIGPYQRGFYCDDESIRLDTKPNTVYFRHVFIGTALLSIAIILICECFLYLGNTAESMLHYRWRNYNVPAFVVNTAKFYGFFHVGFVLQLIPNQIAKYFFGRLRPHFMDTCRPTPGYVCTMPNQYITNFTCIEPTDYHHDWYQMESRMSFFSGHAASSFYFAAFISLYLQSRLATRGIQAQWLTKFQIALLIVASLVSYTRIADNFHHTTDVLFGVFYGMAMGYVTVKYIVGLLIYKDGHVAVENPEGIRMFADFVRPLEDSKIN